MRIATKMFTIISVTVILGLTAILGLVALTVLEDFRMLEEARAADDLERVFEAVDADVADLAVTAREFSDIAGTVLGGNGTQDGNATMDLAVTLFLAGRVETLYFLMDAEAVPGGTEAIDVVDGMALLGMHFDRQALAFGTPDAATNATIAATPFIRDARLLEPSSGLVRASDRTVEVASYPMPGLGGSQAEGWMVLVRPVDDRLVQTIERQTGLDVDLTPATATMTDQTTFSRDGFSTLTATGPIRDSEGAVALTASITQDRSVFRSGLASIGLVGAASYAMAGILTVLTLVLLRATVTSRLADLEKQVRSIRRDGPHHQGWRVDDKGDDEIGWLAAAFNDLLDRLDAHASALQRSNQDLDRFAKVVTHDLKSPLSTFTLNLAMLRDAAERADDQHALKRIGRMEKGAAKMAHRIDHLLDGSRVEAGPLAVDPVDLDALVRGVVEDLQADLVAGDGRVAVAPLPTVRADAESLAQAIQNIISNAVKYRHPERPPRVEVWTETRRNDWRIHIADNGRGFHPADMDRMMEPFTRLSNTQGVEGQGLGLATCAQIMRRHGGSVVARGRPGTGACFTLILPRRPVPQQASDRVQAVHSADPSPRQV